MRQPIFSEFYQAEKWAEVRNTTKNKCRVSLSFVHWDFSSVQSLSRVWLFAAPWTTAHQASLSITNSWSLLKLISIESVMPSNHLILCHPLLLLPSIFSSMRVFSKMGICSVQFSHSVVSDSLWLHELQHARPPCPSPLRLARGANRHQWREAENILRYLGAAEGESSWPKQRCLLGQGIFRREAPLIGSSKEPKLNLSSCQAHRPQTHETVSVIWELFFV